MRRFLLLFVLVLAGCLSCTQLTRPVRGLAVVASVDPMNLTVALVSDKDRTYCAGTWVASDRILTASHCIIDEDTDLAADSVHVRDYDGVVFEGKVIKVDRRVDLALLQAPHAHAWAPVASVWHKGEELTIIGHPAGQEWAWMRGWISAYRKHKSPESDGDMLMLQIQAPVWYGNSGGGAFDVTGALVGVCSLRSDTIPELGLFVAPEEIAAFLLT